ncbi:endonuclease/exonuclease/phosphatase family protein [Kitasatospora sp. NPDC096147]|uniref:endonuclease/exonuclease/phosphatase family protein n=1 Tax=Kitasatospora sp. NPDC096147 TaxID=3364093 RepID=UPI0037FC924B
MASVVAERVAGGAEATPGERRRAVWWRVGYVVAGLAVVPALVLAVVRVGGFDDGTLWAVPIATLPYAALGALLGAAGLLALRAWRTALPAVLLVAVHLAWLLPRVVADAGAVPAEAPRLRVAVSNAYMGQVQPAALVALVREQRVDVLAAVELYPAAARRLEAAGLAELMPHRIATGDTVLYSRTPLAPVGVGTTAGAAAAGEVTVGGKTVRVVPVHTFYPVGDAAEWADGMRELTSEAARSPRNTVMLGDFNATLDHAPMRELLGAGLADTHEELGRGLVPTWPEGYHDLPWLPPVIQIDHVLHGEALRPVAVSEHELTGTDHRAVVAELALTG